MNKIILIALITTLSMADVGKVAVVKGDASIERDVKIIKVHNNMGLLKQDVVETAQGRMQMLFNDNTVISLGRESRFIIKEYLYMENSQKVAATFRIEKGFIKTITGAIGKVMPGLFVLETSNTKITPHGTIWSVDVNDERETYKVLEGRISLVFHDGVERKVELYAGETASLLKASNGTVKSFKKSKFDKGSVNSMYERNLEQGSAMVSEDRAVNYCRMVNSSGNLVMDPSVDDGNNGHGNDPSGCDPSNPGHGYHHGYGHGHHYGYGHHHGS